MANHKQLRASRKGRRPVVVDEAQLELTVEAVLEGSVEGVLDVARGLFGDDDDHVDELDVDVAGEELERVQVTLLGTLPATTTFVAELVGDRAVRWHGTTSRRRYEALRAAGEAVFSGADLSALSVVAQYDRASFAWLGELVAARRRGVYERLDPLVAAGVVPAPGARIAVAPGAVIERPRLTVGQMLRAYGSRLAAIEVG